MNRLFLIVLALVFALPTHAQSTEPLSVTISPQYPRPYQVVTVTPVSNLIDLAASKITIRANGAVVDTGTGLLSTQVQVGAPGTKTTIAVTAVHEGETYTANVTVRPSDVALAVEPLSTAHPFYKGGHLLGAEGRVRLVAIADLRTSSGASIASDNLVYTWRNGNQILESASGIGKSVLIATAPVRYRDAAITVTVASQDRSVVAQAQTVLAPVDPIVRVYRHDPLLGPWYEAALPQNFTMSGTEETFRAVPYFFSALPSLTWQMNGTASGSDRDLTVRSTGEGSGTAVIGVTAMRPEAGQTANASLSVRFGSERSIGIFGL